MQFQLGGSSSTRIGFLKWRCISPHGVHVWGFPPFLVPYYVYMPDPTPIEVWLLTSENIRSEQNFLLYRMPILLISVCSSPGSQNDLDTTLLLLMEIFLCFTGKGACIFGAGGPDCYFYLWLKSTWWLCEKQLIKIRFMWPLNQYHMILKMQHFGCLAKTKQTLYCMQMYINAYKIVTYLQISLKKNIQLQVVVELTRMQSEK